MDQRTQDTLAIVGLANRYTDAVNHRDWAVVRDCWTEDGVWNLGAPVNVAKEGVEAIMEELRRAVGGMDLFFQMNHAGSVLSVDGDTAKARWSLNEVGRIKPEARDLLGGAEGMHILATYTDTLRRCNDGRWRFSRRDYHVVLFDGRAPEGTVFPLPHLN